MIISSSVFHHALQSSYIFLLVSIIKETDRRIFVIVYDLEDSPCVMKKVKYASDVAQKIIQKCLNDIILKFCIRLLKQ